MGRRVCMYHATAPDGIIHADVTDEKMAALIADGWVDHPHKVKVSEPNAPDEANLPVAELLPIPDEEPEQEPKPKKGWRR